MVVKYVGLEVIEKGHNTEGEKFRDYNTVNRFVIKRTWIFISLPRTEKICKTFF